MSLTRLSNFPHPTSQYTILFEKETKSLIAVPYRISDEVYKYSFCGKKWVKYKIQQTYSKTLHENNAYLCIDDHKIIIVELQRRENKSKLQRFNNITHTHATCIMVENYLHYITDKHVKYNTNTNSYSFVDNAPAFKVINENSLIRIKDKLLLIGGSMRYRSIYEYHIKNNFWRCLSVKFPSGVWVVSCTPILSGKIILISAMEYTFEDCNNIYIYERNTQILQKSNIKLLSANNQIFAISDRNRSILATYGWIRIKQRKLNQCLPECLIAMINRYCMDDVLHAINCEGHHYKIEVFKILNL